MIYLWSPEPSPSGSLAQGDSHSNGGPSWHPSQSLGTTRTFDPKWTSRTSTRGTP